jgi:cysteine-rich repeat protein
MNSARFFPAARQCLGLAGTLACLAACAPDGGSQDSSSSSGAADAGQTASSGATGGGSSSGGSGGSSLSSNSNSGNGSGAGNSSQAGGSSSNASPASSGVAISGSSGAVSSSSASSTTVSGGSCERPIALRCNTGVLSLDTAAGSNALDSYACDSTFTYPGRELVFAFSDSANADVTVSAVKSGSGATTFKLFLLGGDPCGGPVSCAASQDNTVAGSSTPPLTFTSPGGATTFLAYDVRGSFASMDTTRLDLTVTCDIKRCGDGIIQPGEACDDGVEPPQAGDGCSATCQLETGYGCRGAPSQCHAIRCGDGLVDTGEGCDDADTPPAGNDGCSASCAQEPGFSCTGEPSICSEGAGTCDQPLSLQSGVPFTFSSEGGSSSTENYGGACGFHSFSGPEVYHAVTVPAGQAVRASLSSAFGGARLVLAESCGAVGGCQATSQSTVAWVNRSANTRTAFVVVDGSLAADKGDYTLNAQVLAPSQFPPGDLCDTAVQLGLPSTTQGDTTTFVSAVPKWLGTCGYVGLGGRSGGGRDAFYRVTIPAGRTLQAVLTGVAANVDSTLSLFSSCADAANTCLKDADANSYGLGETLQYTNSGGTNLEAFLAVDGIQDDRGTPFQLSVSLL